MVFQITKPMSDTLLQAMDYKGRHLQEIQKGIFVMPIYVKGKFNLFMIVGRLVAKDWVAAFSLAKVKHHKDVTAITDLSDPFPTGMGLNMLGSRSPKSADHVLKYFQTLIEAKYGKWRLVK